MAESKSKTPSTKIQIWISAVEDEGPKAEVNNTALELAMDAAREDIKESEMLQGDEKRESAALL